MKLPKFGKIKIDGERCDFHESNVITGTISDDQFKLKLEKPITNKYKIISQYVRPTYENFMLSEIEVEANNYSDAFKLHYQKMKLSMTAGSHDEYGFIMNMNTLEVFNICCSYYLGDLKIHESYNCRLEKPKPKMKKYKLIPNQKTLNPSYEQMMSSQYLIESDSPKNALRLHRNLNPKVNCGIILDVESLDLYRVLYDFSSYPYYHDCFIGKLEKPEVKPKPMNNLSFKTLTEANNKRLPLFKNSKGLPAHSKPDGSDWSHAEWLQAVIGELGEYANIMKKVQRGDLTMEEAKPSIEKELADVMTYFSILAQQLNIDLGQAVEDKFNEVSDRVKANVFIKDNAVYSKEEKHISKNKEKLKAELGKVKVKSKNFPIITNDQLTNFIIGASIGYITNQVYYNKRDSKLAQKTITLQDLNNGKVYTRPFVSGLESNTLQEFSKLIVTDATVMKTLQNGKDYEGFNVNVGDMIQFSDDRNVLYSLRVTKIE